MKNVISLLALTLCISLCGQSEKVISNEWVSFEQSFDYNLTSPKKFKIRVTTKVDSEDIHAFTCLFALEKTKDGEPPFYLTTEDEAIKTNKWQTTELNGILTPNTKNIRIGGYAFYNGLFYFDLFEFLLEDDNGILKPVELENASFEDKVMNNKIPNWSGLKTAKGQSLRIKEFEVRSSDDAIDGKSSLLFEGKGIDSENIGVIGKKDSETPQIDNMISMLEDLKARVVDHTQYLSQYRTDYLLDDKANRIGALIMHLAAAEALYQVVTFEGRGFNEAEKKSGKLP